jgi:hypothetical protein
VVSEVEPAVALSMNSVWTSMLMNYRSKLSMVSDTSRLPVGRDQSRVLPKDLPISWPWWRDVTASRQEARQFMYSVRLQMAFS